MDEPTPADIDRMAAAWYGPIFNPNDDTGIVTAQQRKHAREALLRGVQPPEPQPGYEVERYVDGWAVRKDGASPIARLWPASDALPDLDAQATAGVIAAAANGTGPTLADLAAHQQRAGIYLFTGRWTGYAPPATPEDDIRVVVELTPWDSPARVALTEAQWAAHKGKPVAVYVPE